MSEAAMANQPSDGGVSRDGDARFGKMLFGGLNSTVSPEGSPDLTASTSPPVSPPFSPASPPAGDSASGASASSGMLDLVLPDNRAQQKPSREVAAQRAILSLLQRASSTPEELVLTGYELSELGLLSRDLLASLFASVGIGPDLFATVMRMQQHPTHVADEGSAAVSIHSLLHPADSKPSNALGQPLQGGSLLRAPTRLSVLGTQALGLDAFGMRSRLANEFLLLGRLGQGAGGAVFRARHQIDGSEYALKRVPFWVRPGEVSTQEVAEHVLREVQALARLNHGSVCRYYNAWIETDWHSSFKFTDFSAQMPHNAPPLRLLTDNSGAVDGAWGFKSKGVDLDASLSSLSASEVGEHSCCDSEDSASRSQGSDQSAGMRPPTVHRQWSYRKLLIIQMELCDRHTLRDYMDERNAKSSQPVKVVRDGVGGAETGCLAEMECLGLLRQIAAGLEHVHACGLVHRDVKPSNLCFSRGRLKLVDFGLAKPYGEYTEAGGEVFLAASNNTHGVGTPSYAAPEQLRGGEVSAAADMFPFGLILFEMFNVFRSAMERSKMFDALRQRRVPSVFSERWPELAALLVRLLNESPADRPTCAEVLREIDALLQKPGDEIRVAKSEEDSSTVEPVQARGAACKNQSSQPEGTQPSHGEKEARLFDVRQPSPEAHPMARPHCDRVLSEADLHWRDALISRQALEMRLMAAEIARLEHPERFEILAQ